jgi:single-stranded DNA-binding protein
MNNITTLIGRIGQDPRSVTFPDSDNKVVKFSVGVKEFSSNKDEDSTLWIDVDAWKD